MIFKIQGRAESSQGSATEACCRTTGTTSLHQLSTGFPAEGLRFQWRGVVEENID